MKTTVIIPTWNKANYLERTLAGFYTQSYTDFSIIVVDDGSTDNTKEIVDSAQTKVSIAYISQRNQGRSAARNSALKEINEGIVIFVDDDRIPCKDFVKSHVSQHGEGIDRIVIGSKKNIASGFLGDHIDSYRLSDLDRKKIKNLETRSLEWYFTSDDVANNFESVVGLFGLSETGDSFQDFLKDEDFRRVFRFWWIVATTGNISMRYKPGLFFDTGFEGWGMEDTEFFYRLTLDRKYDFHICSTAANFHQLHPRPPSHAQEMKMNFSYFLQRHNVVNTQLLGLLLSSPMDSLNIRDINEVSEVLAGFGGQSVPDSIRRVLLASLVNQKELEF